MPTTGAELSRELDLQVDKAYTGYLDPAKKNRLFLMAYIQLAEKKYNQMDRQQVYDELTHFVKTDVPVQMRSDKIYTFPLQVNTAVFSGGVLTITTWKENQLQVGDTVNLSGFAGLVNVPSSAVVSSVTSANTFSVAATNVTGVHTPFSGTVIWDGLLSDYHHLLTVKCLYDNELFSPIVGATNSSPVVIEFRDRTNLRTGEQVEVRNVTGNTAANGLVYVKKVGARRYSLFSDSRLSNPIVGNGTYNSGGVVVRSEDSYANVLVSDQKTSSFQVASEKYPKVQISQGYLTFSPKPDSILIDYMTEGAVSPTVRIDVLDNVTDLELYYSKKLLTRLINEAADIFSLQARDLSQYQAQTNETVENP